MNYIVELGVKHLLVDFPSVDRLLDEGRLTCHNIFWKQIIKNLIWPQEEKLSLK